MCLSSPRSTTHPIQSIFKARAFHLPIIFSHLTLDLRSVHFNATLPVYWDLQTNQKLETQKHSNIAILLIFSLVFGFLKTVCYKTLSQLLVLKSQDHFSSCCPPWKAISSVSEVPICLFVVWSLRKLSKNKKEANWMVFV